MDCSPRNTASILSSCSSLDLLPPAGDADPWLHRDYLSPRPHRAVSTSCLETEEIPGYLASSASGSAVRPHPTFFLVYLRYKDLHQELGSGSWDLVAGKGRPHAHEVKVLRGK